MKRDGEGRTRGAGLGALKGERIRKWYLHSVSGRIKRYVLRAGSGTAGDFFSARLNFGWCNVD
jgi:hypothetical protein